MVKPNVGVNQQMVIMVVTIFVLLKWSCLTWVSSFVLNISAPVDRVATARTFLKPPAPCRTTDHAVSQHLSHLFFPPPQTTAWTGHHGEEIIGFVVTFPG